MSYGSSNDGSYQSAVSNGNGGAIQVSNPSNAYYVWQEDSGGPVTTIRPVPQATDNRVSSQYENAVAASTELGLKIPQLAEDLTQRQADNSESEKKASLKREQQNKARAAAAAAKPTGIAKMFESIFS